MTPIGFSSSTCSFLRDFGFMTATRAAAATARLAMIISDFFIFKVLFSAILYQFQGKRVKRIVVLP